jgi:hypothetical protein
LANFAHLNNQSDSEKKAKRHSKALGEKRPNPGSFWFAAVGVFFSPARQGLQSGQFGLRMAQTVHIPSTYCVSSLSYSIAVHKVPAMQYEQANVFQTTRAGDWPV